MLPSYHGHRVRIYVSHRGANGSERLLLLDLTASTVERWLVGLDAAKRLAAPTAAPPQMLKWIRTVFAIADRDETATIHYPQLALFLGAANKRMPTDSRGRHFLQEALSSVGAPGLLIDPHHREFLTFAQAQKLLLTYTLEPHVIGRLFHVYTSEESRSAAEALHEPLRMNVDEWIVFQRVEQGNTDEEGCRLQFNRGCAMCASEHTRGNTRGNTRGRPEALRGLTQILFQWLLLSSENEAVDRDKLELDPSELEHPISHYWTSCSHNSFLDGDQLASHSTPDMYRRVLLTGCRSVRTAN